MLFSQTLYAVPWACHLAAVVDLECLNDSKSHAGWDLIPCRFNLVGLVEEERPNKGQPLRGGGGGGGGVGHGTLHPTP